MCQVALTNPTEGDFRANKSPRTGQTRFLIQPQYEFLSRFGNQKEFSVINDVTSEAANSCCIRRNGSLFDSCKTLNNKRVPEQQQTLYRLSSLATHTAVRAFNVRSPGAGAFTLFAGICCIRGCDAYCRWSVVNNVFLGLSTGYCFELYQEWHPGDFGPILLFLEDDKLKHNVL